jgi:hypothetical protein
MLSLIDLKETLDCNQLIVVVAFTDAGSRVARQP